MRPALYDGDHTTAFGDYLYAPLYRGFVVLVLINKVINLQSTFHLLGYI
jgi:hypothetical protein